MQDNKYCGENEISSMKSEEVTIWVRQIKKRWQLREMLANVLPCLSLAILVTAGLQKLIEVPFWIVSPLFMGIWAFWYWQSDIRKLSDKQVARYLNATFPQLEESGELLLQPEHSLSLVQRLQVERVQKALVDLPQTQVVPFTWLRHLPVVAAFLVAAFFVIQIPVPSGSDATIDLKKGISEISKKRVTPLPLTSTLTLRVMPPAYTGKRAYTQQKAALAVEAGAGISWEITTQPPATAIRLVFNNQQPMSLVRKQEVWKGEKTFQESGFYQVVINGKPSDYYPIQVTPNNPPTLQVLTPEPYREIQYGKPLQVDVHVALQDDFGLADAYMLATVAKGSGEAVKFREEKLTFNHHFQPFQKEASLQKPLNLAAWEMAPGDELYFYIEARDNAGKENRTDMYIVSLADTAQVTLAEGLTLGVNPVPEYFRSQRQIVIDTEKLIKEQKKIKTGEFNQRSNGIGIDQKVLRLRYGKFLGEEFEETIGAVAEKEELLDQGHHDGDGHNHGQDLHALEGFIHDHDNGEESTFLEPVVQTKLRACLAQMWEAELRLRTYRPKDALPFAYKALKLLKEVQQSSRAYVAKTGFEPPPLKPEEKRLTGELEAIRQPKVNKEIKPEVNYPGIYGAMAVLGKIESGQVLTSKEVALLENAGNEMAIVAVKQPGKYLKALRQLRTLIGEVRKQQRTVCESCLISVEKAFMSILPGAEPQVSPSESSKNTLSGMYFERL